MCDSVRPRISNASALALWNNGGKGCQGTGREPSRTTPTSHRTTATGQGEFEPQRHPTTLSLNQKQFLVVRKILSHAIKRHGKPTLEAEDQMLLAVAGEEGVGKTRVIKAPTTSVVVPSTPP
jgi:hypothetical protein